MGNYIPKDQFVSRRTVEIVKRSEIEQEYAHLTANIELLRRDPTLMRHGGTILFIYSDLVFY